jgi:GNAT superfamily N-acetyltransferase
MEELVPFLEDALAASKERLKEALGRDCRIYIHVHMSEELARIVERIDHERFRLELRYTLEELMDRGGRGGFALFVLTCGGESMAFLYGYTDEQDGSKFFIDSVATLIEGKGIGSILVTLALVYCYETGYRSAGLYTEEVDERGRRLVKFYEDLGFEIVEEDPDRGVVMSSRLEPDKLRSAYMRYIGRESKPLDFRSLRPW